MDSNNTLGCLEVPDLSYPLFTNELSWNNNRKNISCISAGIYIMKPYNSENHGNCFKILDVEGRSNILLHIGNTFKDSKGCILVGLTAGQLGHEEAVLKSKLAMEILIDLIKNPVELHIRNSFI